jgi:hypothetical protein
MRLLQVFRPEQSRAADRSAALTQIKGGNAGRADGL